MRLFTLNELDSVKYKNFRLKFIFAAGDPISSHKINWYRAKKNLCEACLKSRETAEMRIFFFVCFFAEYTKTESSINVGCKKLCDSWTVRENRIY